MRRLSVDNPRLIAPALALLFVVLALVGWLLLRPMLHADRPVARTPIGAAAPPPGTPPPAVVPNQLLALAPDAARELNNAQPFATTPNPPARPFTLGGGGLSSLRATDCLTAAVLYEAGDDPEGQRAVAQVVLNRVRHPAYPKTVCGVVFQGSERGTGCQFTFTCDGALARRYSESVWARARGIAIDALNGAVFAPVGLATHYHTDWVRPTWSGSMEKIAQVGTHLFFRWPGYWGTQSAMVGRVGGEEPVEAKLAPLSAAHLTGVSPDELAALNAPPSAAEVSAAVSAVVPRANVQLGDTIILNLARDQPPATFPALAEAACGNRGYCKVMGWTNPALMPSSEAMSETQRSAMSFSYLRDQPHNLERALWNCDEFGREEAVQCMRR